MIPEDEDPGALSLGCEEFVLARIAEELDLYDLYVLSLSSLQAAGFETLSTSGQDALLSAVPSAFVEQLAAHAMEAAYTHPVGMKMVGFEVTG